MTIQRHVLPNLKQNMERVFSHWSNRLSVAARAIVQMPREPNAPRHPRPRCQTPILPTQFLIPPRPRCLGPKSPILSTIPITPKAPFHFSQFRLLLVWNRSPVAPRLLGRATFPTSLCLESVAPRLLGRADAHFTLPTSLCSESVAGLSLLESVDGRPRQRIQGPRPQGPKAPRPQCPKAPKAPKAHTSHTHYAPQRTYDARARACVCARVFQREFAPSSPFGRLGLVPGDEAPFGRLGSRSGRRSDFSSKHTRAHRRARAGHVGRGVVRMCSHVGAFLLGGIGAFGALGAFGAFGAFGHRGLCGIWGLWGISGTGAFGDRFEPVVARRESPRRGPHRSTWSPEGPLWGAPSGDHGLDGRGGHTMYDI